MSEKGYILPVALFTLAVAAALTAAAHGHLASVVSGFKAASFHLRNAFEERSDRLRELTAEAPVLGTTCSPGRAGRICRSCSIGGAAGATSLHSPALDYDRLFAIESTCEEWREEGFRTSGNRTALAAMTCLRLAEIAEGTIVSRASVEIDEVVETRGCTGAPCLVAAAGHLRLRELRISGATIVVGGGGIELGKVSITRDAAPIPVPLIVDYPAGELATLMVAPEIRVMTLSEARERGIVPGGGCRTLGFWVD